MSPASALGTGGCDVLPANSEEVLSASVWGSVTARRREAFSTTFVVEALKILVYETTALWVPNGLADRHRDPERRGGCCRRSSSAHRVIDGPIVESRCFLIGEKLVPRLTQGRLASLSQTVNSMSRDR